MFLGSVALERRWTKPSAVGARAVAGESGTQSGNLGAPLAGLADQVAPQGHSQMAQSHHFLSQSHRRFG
jgi:hypothetical protein